MPYPTSQKAQLGQVFSNPLYHPSTLKIFFHTSSSPNPFSILSVALTFPSFQWYPLVAVVLYHEDYGMRTGYPSVDILERLLSLATTLDRDIAHASEAHERSCVERGVGSLSFSKNS